MGVKAVVVVSRTKMKEQPHTYLDLGGKFHYGNCSARRWRQKSARPFPYRDMHVLYPVRSLRGATEPMPNGRINGPIMRSVHVILPLHADFSTTMTGVPEIFTCTPPLEIILGRKTRLEGE